VPFLPKFVGASTTGHTRDACTPVSARNCVEVCTGYNETPTCCPLPAELMQPYATNMARMLLHAGQLHGGTAMRAVSGLRTASGG